MIKLIGLVFFMMTSLLLVACQSSHEDIDRYIDTQQQKAERLKISAVPELINYQSIVFVNAKKDPFKIPLSVDSNSTDNRKDQKFLTPLEKYSLGDLRLVGVINQGEKKWALIEIKASKMVYPITVGDYIGNRFGQVEAIDAKKISIIEKIKSASGNFKEEKAELKL
ncbi:pilus assembly protein PilP [Thiotrichales bacterium 19S3-7]|nr:pilus assembly protein PilP [Thiotrichales bacterium 19S3-7]MCF6800784.1 pilus assembly protein PilP [Thiotrichales bacterium 19S3-11]